MTMEIRILEPGDEQIFDRTAEDVFDFALRKELAAEFIADPRHHIAVAIEDGVVIGFASGVDYIHPDKPSELWINEVAVTPARQRKGIAGAVLSALIDHGKSLGCTEAWVLTDNDNTASRALYKSAGGTENTRVVYVTFPMKARGQALLDDDGHVQL